MDPLFFNSSFRMTDSCTRLKHVLSVYEQSIVQLGITEKTLAQNRKILNDVLAEAKSFLSLHGAQNNAGMTQLKTLVKQAKHQLKNASVSRSDTKPNSKLDLSVVKIIEDKPNSDGSRTTTFRTNRRFLGELSVTLPKATGNGLVDTFDKINYGATKAFNGFIGDLTVGLASLPQAGLDAASRAKAYAANLTEAAAHDQKKAAKKLLKDAATGYFQHLPIMVAGQAVNQWRKDRISEFNTTRQTAGLLAASTETLVHGALDIASVGKLAKKGAPGLKPKGTLPKSFQPFVEHINKLSAKTYATMTKEQIRISFDVLKANQAQPGVKQALNTLNRLAKSKPTQTAIKDRHLVPSGQQRTPLPTAPSPAPPSTTIIPSLSTIEPAKTHKNKNALPKRKVKSKPVSKKMATNNELAKKNTEDSLRRQHQDAAWGRQTAGHRTFNQPEEFDPFNPGQLNNQESSLNKLTPEEIRNNKLQLQRETDKLSSVYRYFEGIKFSLKIGFLVDDLWQNTYTYAKLLKSAAELKWFMELLESTPQTKEYFEALIAQKHKMLNVLTTIETDFYNNPNLSYVDDFIPINTSKIFQLKTDQVYEDLIGNNISVEKLAVDKKTSILSKFANGARFISQSIETNLNNISASKIKKEKNATLKIEKNLGLTKVLSPAIDHDYLKNMFWVKDRGSEHESNVHPFGNLTQADFIRLNIMHLDKAKKIKEIIRKYRSELHWKCKSEYEYKSNDPSLLYLQDLTFEALSPRYDQVVLRHVIQMQKEGKSPLNSENFNRHEAGLLRKAIIPDFFELGSYRHNFIDLFVDTDLSLQEVEKFKVLTDRIYAFTSMYTKSNKYDDFLNLLNRYAVSKIAHKHTYKEPVKGIFDNLLIVNPRITDLNRSQFKLTDPTLDAYLEKLTQIMKHELNEW